MGCLRRDQRLDGSNNLRQHAWVVSTSGSVAGPGDDMNNHTGPFWTPWPSPRRAWAVFVSASALGPGRDMNSQDILLVLESIEDDDKKASSCSSWAWHVVHSIIAHFLSPTRAAGLLDFSRQHLYPPALCRFQLPPIKMTKDDKARPSSATSSGASTTGSVEELPRNSGQRIGRPASNTVFYSLNPPPTLSESAANDPTHRPQSSQTLPPCSTSSLPDYSSNASTRGSGSGGHRPSGSIGTGLQSTELRFS